jgi:hypothetical protein
MAIAPLTELDAVNMILRNDGEAPVDTLDDTGFSEVADAVSVLNNIAAEEQTRGWAYNTDYEVRLLPDAITGQIALTDDVLQVTPTLYSLGMDVVERGRKLYDLRANSYVFTAPVYLNIIRFLPFNDLPAYARVHIAIRAARRYQAQGTGSPRQDSFTLEHELKAEASCLKSDQRSRRRGHFRRGQGLYATQRRPM